ncbi:MAG: hypothetical protein IJX47_08880 [Clostridia bacterium]|nr:hypothetical protein [Clostridia bacterium]
MKGTLLKGANRRMVVVRSRDSKLFEEAHFILREESADAALPDLLEEANRIVEKSHFPAPRRAIRKNGIPFTAGVFMGAGVEALGLAVYFLFR